MDRRWRQLLMGSGAEVLQDNNYNSTSMEVYGSRTKNFPDDEFYVKNVWISTILIFLSNF